MTVEQRRKEVREFLRRYQYGGGMSYPEVYRVAWAYLDKDVPFSWSPTELDDLVNRMKIFAYEI